MPCLEQVQKIDLTGIADERTRAIVGLWLDLVEDLRGKLKKAHLFGSDPAVWAGGRGRRPR